MSLDDDLARGYTGGRGSPAPSQRWEAPSLSSPHCTYCQHGSLQTLQTHLDSLIHKYTEQKAKLKEAKKLLREYASGGTPLLGSPSPAPATPTSSSSQRKHHTSSSSQGAGSTSDMISESTHLAALQSLQDELSRLQSDLASITADSQTKTMSLRSRELEVNTLHQTIQSKNGRIELLQKEVEKMKKQATTAASSGWTSILGGGGAVAEAKSLLLQKDKQISALEDALGQGLEAQRQAVERLEESRAETKVKEESVVQLHQTLQHARANLEESEAKVKRLQGELEAGRRDTQKDVHALKQQLHELQSSLTHDLASSSASDSAFQRERARYRQLMKEVGRVWRERVGWDDQAGLTGAIQYESPTDQLSFPSIYIMIPDLPLLIQFHRSSLLSLLAFSGLIQTRIDTIGEVVRRRLIVGWMKLDTLTSATYTGSSTHISSRSMLERLQEEVEGNLKEMKERWVLVERGLKEIKDKNGPIVTAATSPSSSLSNVPLDDPLLLLTPLSSLLRTFAQLAAVQAKESMSQEQHDGGGGGQRHSNASHQLRASWLQAERVFHSTHVYMESLKHSLVTEEGERWRREVAPVMSLMLPAAWPMEWLRSSEKAAASLGSTSFPLSDHITSFLSNLRSTLTSIQSHFASTVSTLPSVSQTHSSLLLGLLQPPILLESILQEVGNLKEQGREKETREMQGKEWKRSAWSTKSHDRGEEGKDFSPSEVELSSVALANTAVDLIDTDNPLLPYLTPSLTSSNPREVLGDGKAAQNIGKQIQHMWREVQRKGTDYVSRLNRSSFSYQGAPSGNSISPVLSIDSSFAPPGVAYSLALHQRCSLASLHADFSISSARYAELANEHKVLTEQHSSLLREHSTLLSELEKVTDSLSEKDIAIQSAHRRTEETRKLAEERMQEVAQQRMLVEELRSTIDALQQQMDAQVEEVTASMYTHQLPPSEDSPQQRKDMAPNAQRGGRSTQDELEYEPISSSVVGDAAAVPFTLEDAITANDISVALCRPAGVDSAVILPDDTACGSDFASPSRSLDARTVARDWLEQARLFSSLAVTQNADAAEACISGGNMQGTRCYEIDMGEIPAKVSSCSIPRDCSRSTRVPAVSHSPPVSSTDVSFALRQAIAATPQKESAERIGSGVMLSPPYMPHVSPEVHGGSDQSLIGLEHISEDGSFSIEATRTKQNTVSSIAMDTWFLHQLTTRLHSSTLLLHSHSQLSSTLAFSLSSTTRKLERRNDICERRAEQAKEARQTSAATLRALGEVQLARSASEQSSKELIDELGERIHELTMQLAEKDAQGGWNGRRG